MALEPVGAVRVRGLRELDRALKQSSVQLEKRLVTELKMVAEPVKVEAQQLAGREIRNVLSPTAEKDWWLMRVGFARRDSIVYVAPGVRNAGGSPRPNFGRLLMDRAMQPALDHNKGQIEAGVERLLDRITTQNGF